MGYIYKITNDINNKIYIGQTTDTLKARFRSHCKLRESNKNMPIDIAIKKYGKEHFKIETIEECDDSLLNEKEVYWIKYYNSTNKKFGYNITHGGSNFVKHSQEECDKWWNDFINGMFVYQIAKKYNISNITVAKYFVNKDKETYLKINQERHFKISSSIIKKVNKKERTHRKINQYDLDGNFIKTWDSAEETGYNKSVIYSSCRGIVKSSYGYQWRYADCNEYIGAIKKLTVYKCDKCGNIVKEYPNQCEAARDVGVTQTAINNAINGRAKSCAGYYWRGSL